MVWWYICNIMAEGISFYAFGFSEAENLSVQCMNTGVNARGRSGRVTQMSQWPRWETGLESAGDVTHRKRAEDFGRFEKVS